MVGRDPQPGYHRELNFLSQSDYAGWGRCYRANHQPADSADRYAFL